MDEKSPPENTQTTEIVKEPAMATLVAAIPAPPAMLDAPPPNNTANAAGAGVNKRYRPAPAKTFQCRGYGDCRMVFSRSEHLARHIRKHTGERPFSCHCGKQFSRLDNLRQHAQTVHADKQELNDKMMRELTSLHASMTAATKGGPVRGKRGSISSAGQNATISSPTSSASPTEGDSASSVKQEDVPPAIPAMSQHPRPGTSTGYEGDNGIIYQHIPGSSAWHPQNPSPIANNPRPASNYSFRDSLNGFGQSFRTSPTTYSYFGQYSSGQSFLGSPKSRDSRLESSFNRSTSDARSLPPINAVVSSSLTSPSQQPQPQHSTYVLSQPPPPTAAGPHILPLPTPTALRRPATSASRPTTAPASYYCSPPGNGSAHGRQLPFLGSHGIRLGFTGAELSIPVYGGGKLGGGLGVGDLGPTSPTTGESPFSFHPPALVAESSVIPRKRPFPGSDDDSVSAGNATEYDYGTESRPQSRRLSVMELCNDTDITATPPRTATGDSRPGSRAILQSISAALDDRPRTSPGGTLFPANKTTASGADASSAQTAQAVRWQFGNGNGISPEVAGRRILQTSGDSKRFATRSATDSPIPISTRSPIQESAIPSRSAASSFGFASGVARSSSSATGAGRESPGNDKVRLSAGYAPVGMKA